MSTNKISTNNRTYLSDSIGLSLRDTNECRRMAYTALCANPNPYTAALSFAESRMKEAKLLYGKAVPEYEAALSPVERHQLQTALTILLIANENCTGPYEEKVTALLLDCQREAHYGRIFHNTAYELIRATSERGICAIPDSFIASINRFVGRPIISKSRTDVPVNLTSLSYDGQAYVLSHIDGYFTKRIIDKSMQTAFAEQYIHAQAC